MYNKLNLMIGMLNTKEHTEYLRHLIPLADTLIITEPNFRNKMPAQKLYQIAQQIVDENNYLINVCVRSEWKEALNLLSEMTKRDELVFSRYLLGSCSGG